MHSHTSKKGLIGTAIVLSVLASWYPGTLNAVTVAKTRDAGVLAQAIIIPATPTTSGDLTVQEPTDMDIWLAKLAFQESGGNDHLKVLDVNGKYSYGCLQFQEGTFRSYALKYGFISDNTPTASVIYDCSLQKKIAKLMLANDYSNWRAWYNSSKHTSVGLPPANG